MPMLVDPQQDHMTMHIHTRWASWTPVWVELYDRSHDQVDRCTPVGIQDAHLVQVYLAM